MQTRKLTISTLVTTLILMAGCSSTAQKNIDQPTGEHWTSCAIKGGLTLGLPGAAYNLATGGAAFAAGAILSGTACALAEPLTDKGSLDVPVLRDVETVNFAFNSTEITSQDEQKLSELLKHITSDNHIMITGHACDIGTREYNQDLSERRALAVKRWLMNRGVPEDHIKTQGKGEDEPVRGNETEEMRQENRRAQIVLK